MPLPPNQPHPRPWREDDEDDGPRVVRPRRSQVADAGTPASEPSATSNGLVDGAESAGDESVPNEPVSNEPVSNEPLASAVTQVKELLEEPHDGEYVPFRRPSRKGKAVLAITAITIAIVGAAAGGIFLWASQQITPSGEQGPQINSLIIPAGSSTEQIGEILATADVIADARVFGVYTRLKGEGPWNAGEYADFYENSSFTQAIAVLDAGPVPETSTVIRIGEGTRLVEALDRIAEQAPWVTAEELFLALGSGEVTNEYKPASVDSWEGFLFPDTYQVADNASAVEILQRMSDQMERQLDSLDYDRAETLYGMSAYELITAASLIERETGQPADERAKISRVIRNRLSDDEALGIDAAVLYGLDRSSGVLTQSDLDQDTPYNNRMHKGLPPTPIGLPSFASLEAAAQPADGDWKWYVLTSNDPPSHFFTNNYDEFLSAKNQAQRDGVF